MSRSSQETVSASTAQALGSGTDTNLVSLQLYLVANMSTWGRCQVWHRRSNTSWWRDHSVWMIWPCRDSLSAITFRRPGMCLAFRTICLRSHQHRSRHRRTQSEHDLIDPSLFMYATSVVLSVTTRTICLCTMCWNLFKASRTAFNSRKFMCSWLSGTDQEPLAVKSPKWAP